MKIDQYYKLSICSIFGFYILIEILDWWTGKRIYFWDLNIYVRAVYDYGMGVSPYRDDVDLMFIYHPYILKIFICLDKILPLKIALLSMYSISAIFFCKQFNDYVMLKKKNKGEEGSLSIRWILLPAVSFGGAVLSSFKMGNLSIYLHFFVLGMFLISYKKASAKMIFFFICSIIFVSVIKPYYLAYLILLIFLTDYKKSIISILSVSGLVFFIWISGNFFLPVLFDEFIRALMAQIVADFGYSIFGLVQNLTNNLIGISAHLIIMLLSLVGFVIYVKQKGYKANSDQFIPLAIIFIVFLNPRMQVYDFPIAILFGFTFLFIYNQAIFLKVVSISIWLTSVPLFSQVLSNFGAVESIWFLNLPKHFQLLGFIFLSFYIFYTIMYLEIVPSKKKLKKSAFLKKN
jgi:hypothetical protein